MQDKAKELRVRTRNASGRLSNALTLVRNSGPLPRKPGERGQECQRELLDSQRPTLTTRFGNLFEKDVDHEKALHCTRRSGDLGRRNRVLSRLVCAFVQGKLIEFEGRCQSDGRSGEDEGGRREIEGQDQRDHRTIERLKLTDRKNHDYEWLSAFANVCRSGTTAKRFLYPSRGVRPGVRGTHRHEHDPTARQVVVLLGLSRLGSRSRAACFQGVFLLRLLNHEEIQKERDAERGNSRSAHGAKLFRRIGVVVVTHFSQFTTVINRESAHA